MIFIVEWCLFYYLGLGILVELEGFLGLKLIKLINSLEFVIKPMELLVFVVKKFPFGLKLIKLINSLEFVIKPMELLVFVVKKFPFAT
jgi:hypothetical protein